jgi:hypothetical protein
MCAAHITVCTTLCVNHAWRHVPDYVCSIHNGTYQLMCAALETVRTRLRVKPLWRYVPDCVWSLCDGTYQIMCEACVTVRTRLCVKPVWWYIPDYVWSLCDGTYQIVHEASLMVRTRLWSLCGGTYQIMYEACVTVRTSLYVKPVWRYVPDCVWSLCDGTYQIVCEACLTVRTRLCVQSTQCNVTENFNLHVINVRLNPPGSPTHSDTVTAGITETITKFSPPAFRDGHFRYSQTAACMNINLVDFLFGIDDCIYEQHGHEPWVGSFCGRSEKCTLNFACETWKEGRYLKI